jgi:hypothetical protein
MERADRSKISYQVEIPIKGWISIEHDGIGMGNVTFHLDNDVFSAKTDVDVEGSIDDIEFEAMIFEAIKRVNKVLDKIAFETGASIRIEKNGIKAKRISEPIENPTGEILYAMESIVIKLEPPAINEDTLIEAAKLESNLMQSKYKYFQKSLSHYRNGLNAESDGNPKAFLDYWESIEVITNKYGEGEYTKNKIYDCFEKCCGERNEDEVKELYKIRQDAAHGLNDVSDPAEIKIMIEKTPRIKKLAKLFLSSWARTSRLRMPHNSELEFVLYDGDFAPERLERLGIQFVVVAPESHHDQKSELDV